MQAEEFKKKYLEWAGNKKNVEDTNEEALKKIKDSEPESVLFLSAIREGQVAYFGRHGMYLKQEIHDYTTCTDSKISGIKPIVIINILDHANYDIGQSARLTLDDCKKIRDFLNEILGEL
jgi:hypothetical protein